MEIRARFMLWGIVLAAFGCSTETVQTPGSGLTGGTAATTSGTTGGLTTTGGSDTTSGSATSGTGTDPTTTSGVTTGTTTGGQGGSGGSDDAGGVGPDPDAGGQVTTDATAPPIDSGSALANKKGLWDFAGLLRIRASASSGPLKPAYDAVIAMAETAMTVGPFSVMNKTSTPPSGNKHDYMGMGRYFWPDPTKANGLPYISRDGESNPEVDSDKYDYHSMLTMSGAVNMLGLAYFLTRNEKYATKAHDLMVSWYVDPATKMNPNLNYAQSVPGLVTGRKEGVIDTLQMAYMIDGLEMLRDSPTFTTADFDAITAWFTSFVDWLRTSAFGTGEEAATNNHGSWYDVQTMRYAIFLGNTTLATQLANLAKTRRIMAQINPDGSEPQEIARTNSLYYSEYDLTANFDIAHLAAIVGVDLFNYQTTDGRSVRKALDYLVPYADPAKVWPNPEIIKDDRSLLVPLLRRAAAVYNAPAYETTLQMYYTAILPANITQLVYPK